MITSTKVVIDLYDVTAKEDGTYTANTIYPQSVISNIDKGDRQSIKLATFEKNQFLLDGSCKLKDNSVTTDDYSYWSNTLSGTDGKFATAPALTRSFSKGHTSRGITIYFDTNYARPTEVYVGLFDNANNVIDEGTFIPTFDEYLVADVSGDNFRKIVIKINKVAEPYTRARVLAVEYGQSLKYSSTEDKNVATATLLEELDVTSSTLASNTSKIKVIDPDSSFSITNPNGLYKYLQKRQLVKIIETIDGVDQDMAYHYLRSWDTENDVVSTFECQDIIGIMSETQFRGKRYSDTVKNIIDDIMNDFGFTDYRVSADISGLTLNGTIAPCSHREALQQVLFACMGVGDTSRISGINFYKASMATSTNVDSDRIFMNPKYKITQNDLVSELSLTAHNYVIDDTQSEIYSANLNSGEYFVTLKEPISAIYPTNCTVLEWGNYWARIRVNAQAQVVLKGKVYKDYTSLVTVSDDTSTKGIDLKTVSITNATLVGVNNVQTVADYLYKMNQYRLEHDLRIILGNERVGSTSVFQMKENHSSALIKSMEIDLTGGFLAKIKAVSTSLKIEDYPYARDGITNAIELYANDQIGVL